MKREWIRFSSVILLVFFLFAVVTGCGSKPADTTKEGENLQEDAPAGEETQEEIGEEVVEEPEQKYDFGGRKIIAMAWWDQEPVAGTSEWADLTIEKIAQMEEKYNVDFEFLQVPWMEYLEKITSSSLAGSPVANWAWLEYQWFWPGLVSAGFLEPLDDFGIFDFNDEKWDQTALSVGMYEGKHYGFGTGRPSPRGVFFWNKTIFERDGLPNLYELYQKKQWNWDALLEVAQKATKDLDGDGIIDQYGIGGHDIGWHLFYSNGVQDIYFENGEWKLGLNDPRGIKALQFWQDLMYKYNVIPPKQENFWDWQLHLTEFKQGRIAMLFGEFWMGDSMGDMEAEYGAMMTPMGPDATEYVSKAQSVPVCALLSGNEKQEEVAIFLNEWTEPLPNSLSPDEEWVTATEGRVRDRESIECLRPVIDSNAIKSQLYVCINEIVPVFQNIEGAIRDNAKTPQVAVEEYIQQAQAIIDEVLNKK